MPKITSVWKNTCKRYVAFLDIMGFRDMVFRESHDVVKGKLESLRPTIEMMKVITEVHLSKENNKSLDQAFGVFPVTFSDSIIMISYDESNASAMSILGSILYISQQAFEKGIPMKGAVACGEMTADIEGSLYFGKPLIDAFELQQELQLYGVILHHTCERQINDLKSLGDKGVVKYSVPMKLGAITHYILDWTPLFEDTKESINAVSNLYNTVSGSPRIYVDNTVEFVQWRVKKRTELAKQKKPSNRPSTGKRPSGEKSKK